MVLLGAGVLWAQQEAKNPFAGNAREADAGRGLFRIRCSPCHGIKAEGGRGPDLTRGGYSVGDRDADLYRVIADGAPGTEMPGFAAVSPEEDIWRLVSYLRSIARQDTTSLPGDPARGEKLFWGKGACGGCHRVGVKGGRLGPDLTRAGRTRSLAYLRAALLTPDAELTPGYATITVVTRDNRKIIGVEKGFDNFSAQLLDAQENLHSYLRSEVQSVRREFRSLMPDYSKSFSQPELDDMLAYLVSLRGEATR